MRVFFKHSRKSQFKKTNSKRSKPKITKYSEEPNIPEEQNIPEPNIQNMFKTKDIRTHTHTLPESEISTSKNSESEISKSKKQPN